MITSESISDLAAALCKAQTVMGGALKDSANPFFKSKYADLESVWSACRQALTSNGLSVVQGTDGTDVSVGVSTRLIHTSGQWIESTVWMTPKDGSPQAVGSAITYARRYGLAAMVGIYQTDDDAESAQGRTAQGAKTMQHSPAPDPEYVVDREIVEEYAATVRDLIAKNDVKAMQAMQYDLRDDETMFTAVWKALNTKEKTAFREAVKAAK
jgi:hypothetical protein